MDLILTADIGTTALKAAVFLPDGTAAASCTREYSFRTPGPGMAEIPAGVYTETFRDAVGAVIREAGVSAEDIRVLGLSTQGETMLLLDSEGRPLRDAILWCDTRAAAEAEAISRRFGPEEIQSRTGQVGADAIWPGAKLLWLKEHEPDLFARTARVVWLEGWFSLLLTGRAAGEDSILCSSVFFDIRKRCWWPEMLSFLGLDEAQLPEIVRPGAIAGAVTEDAAARFGLKAGTLLSIGGIDLACGAVGSGNVRPGSFSDVTGSALCTMTMADHVVLDPAGGMPCYCSAVPGLYMVHAYASGGICLRWYRDVFGKALPDSVPGDLLPDGSPSGGSGMNDYDRMDLLAAGSPPGADGLIALPHLTGSGPPDLCPGMKGALIGLTPAHRQKHIVRAFMEGVAMILCRIIEATEALGLESGPVVCLGGGAKSPVWCQIKADASGREVIASADTENACCLGAAILAGSAAGIFPGIEEAAGALVREGRHYLPDPERHAFYRRLYARYRKLMDALAPLYKES